MSAGRTSETSSSYNGTRARPSFRSVPKLGKNVTTLFHAPPGASGEARSTRIRNHQGADARGRRRRQKPAPVSWPHRRPLEVSSNHILTCMLLSLVGFGISKVNGCRSPTSIPSLPRSGSLTKYMHLLKSKGLLSDERIELLSCSVRFAVAASPLTHRPPYSRKIPKGSKPVAPKPWRRRTTLPILVAVPSKSVSHSLDARRQDTVLRGQKRPPRSLGLPSARRDPRHTRVFLRESSPRSPSLEHTGVRYFGGLLFKSAGLPEKGKLHA